MGVIRISDRWSWGASLQPGKMQQLRPKGLRCDEVIDSWSSSPIADSLLALTGKDRFGLTLDSDVFFYSYPFRCDDAVPSIRAGWNNNNPVKYAPRRLPNTPVRRTDCYTFNRQRPR